MFNFILAVGLFSGLLFWIAIKLKNWRQRALFIFVLFIAVPGVLLYWYKVGYSDRERKLKEAQAACRNKKSVDDLQIIFSGFSEQDITENLITVHKDIKGKVLDSNQQEVDTGRYYNGALSISYYYRHPFQVNDVIEINAGNKKYILTNFVLTAIANYNMGGPVLGGCRIDSADINGKKVPFSQNMIVHKSDSY